MKRVLIACLMLCAAAAAAQEPPPTQPTPFVVNRGSAPPPPAPASSAQAAPAEGVSASGIDFGQWRSADPERYGEAFDQQMRQRFAGRDGASARAELEQAGFACHGDNPMQCRIEIVDGGCEKDWYVVFERARAEPISGFDSICLARR